MQPGWTREGKKKRKGRGKGTTDENQRIKDQEEQCQKTRP